MEALLSGERFTIKQTAKPRVYLYEVFAGENTGGEPVSFGVQRRLTFWPQLRFFGDRALEREQFRISAQRSFKLGQLFEVSAQGKPIGSIYRSPSSFLRASWRLYDVEGTLVLEVVERSSRLALLRRLKNLTPFTDFIPVPYRFEFLQEGKRLGGLEHAFSFRDQYLLALDGGRIDRRLAFALAVSLDALQAH